LTDTALRTATAGAEVLTYEPVERLSHEDGVHLVTLRDGATVRGRTVVLATGPWTGNQLLGSPGDGLLTLSKGVHLVVPAASVPVRAPVVIQVPGQRRILFAIPWGARTYLGTTDSAFEGDPGSSGVTEAEEAEVLALVQRVLPCDVPPEHVLSAWSGVRPLVTAKRRGSTVELARTHRIVENEDGVLAIVGGKLTTYRAMAEDVVDRIVSQLGARPEYGGSPARPCTTHLHPLLPPDLPPHPNADSEIGRALASRHGAATPILLETIDQSPELAAPLVQDLPYRWVEIEHAIAYEGVRHLDDLLRRRIPLALTDERLGGRVMHKVAKMLVSARGGSQRDIDEEVERYGRLVETETRRRPRA
ncbi:MAG: FAD-dependent oxidoreductase, partial [Nannocystaceae bacterium]